MHVCICSNFFSVFHAAKQYIQPFLGKWIPVGTAENMPVPQVREDNAHMTVHVHVTFLVGITLIQINLSRPVKRQFFVSGKLFPAPELHSEGADEARDEHVCEWVARLCECHDSIDRRETYSDTRRCKRS